MACGVHSCEAYPKIQAGELPTNLANAIKPLYILDSAEYVSRVL